MMIKMIPAAGAIHRASGMTQESFVEGLKDFLRSLGFMEDPFTAPSRGVQHCASDYLAYGVSVLGGIAVGFYSVKELGKLFQSEGLR